MKFTFASSSNDLSQSTIGEFDGMATGDADELLPVPFQLNREAAMDAAKESS
jgi:hypothetical protein